MDCRPPKKTTNRVRKFDMSQKRRSLSANVSRAESKTPSKTRVKTVGGVSDLPLAEWKQYDDILTDSLWMMENRDKSGGHDGFYHGNFVPQIPNQLLRRYTAAGDSVLDVFLGSGTTLIEAKRLGRNGIGVELSPKVAKIAGDAVKKQSVELSAIKDVFNEVIVGDSANRKSRTLVKSALKKHGRDGVELVVCHPPYHDIIKFSDDENDLSNSANVEEFVKSFGKMIANFSPLLRDNRYLAVVIGDKYADSKWIPLGFMLMNETMRRDSRLALKSIVVKNMVNNRAKRNKENLWRYRALAGGFYVFRHEYVFLFQKQKA